MSTSKTRDVRLALRRERLFDKHDIKVEENHHTEKRFYKTREGKQEPYYIEFTHTVKQRGEVVAHAGSRRHALKSALKSAHNRLRKIRG